MSTIDTTKSISKMEKRNTANKLRKNVRKNYLYTFIASFDLTSGIWMLYLAFKGLSLFEIGLMESVYHLSSFTMEIPTGIIADIFGRKTSRNLGRIANILSTIIMIMTNNIFFFGVSFFLTALGNNLESGAGEALVYDSMKEINEESGYMKVKGRQEIFFQLAKTLSLLVGGYLGTLDYSYVYKLALVVSSVAFFQSLTFVEPNVGKVEIDGNIGKTFVKQLLTSIKVIKNDLRIAFLIVSVEVFGTFVTTEFFYIQNYLKSVGRNELQIGIVLSIGALAAVVAATNTHKIEKKFKFKGILTVMPLLGILCFWCVTITRLTEVGIILLTAVEGILFVATSDYINRLIPSEQRATILSFQSMAFSFFMILLFPVIGKLGDIHGLMSAFKVIAMISTVMLLGIVAMVRLNKNIDME